MFTRLLVAIAFLAFPVSAIAQDAIAPAVVDNVKKSSVFVRTEGDGWGATGSGFVVAGDDKTLYIATNEHVIANSPPPGLRPGKPPTLSVVFDSGTKTERSFPAIVAAADVERDLAVLKVSGVKAPPPALQVIEGGKLTETMTVYSFGFPFGKALSADDKSPAITVGKASISSLRNGPDGELQVIQIDGNLNPGNSGGPVVDLKGKIVGVAVATLRDGQGIGFIIPAKELSLMLQGRVGNARLVSHKTTDDKITRKLEVTLVDPINNLRGVSARYLVVPVKGKRPEGDSLSRQPEAKLVTLKVANGMASTEIPLVAADGEVLVQLMLETANRQIVTSKVRVFPLSTAGASGPPPRGWKEFRPADGSFVIWIPEKPARQSEGTRVRTVNGKTVFVSSLTGETADGLSYEVQAILTTAFFAKTPRKELAELFRDLIASETKGRVTETKEVEVGDQTGFESVIEARGETTRMRVFVTEMGGVYIATVSGTSKKVSTPEATTLLSAFRPLDPSASGPSPTSPVATAPGKGVSIHGGGNDPVFTDLAPDGGLLIGLEVGVSLAFGRNMTRAIRPIYRVKSNTVFGDQQGTQLDDVVTLKAKDGYAVGGVSVMHGLGFDGIQITFMKVVDGNKLDPKDSYQSQYVGSDEKKALTKIGGDGTPVVGITGRGNDKDVTGFGLLLKGQESAKQK